MAYSVEYDDTHGRFVIRDPNRGSLPLLFSEADKRVADDLARLLTKVSEEDHK
jgi:hypothetical protein